MAKKKKRKSPAVPFFDKERVAPSKEWIAREKLKAEKKAAYKKKKRKDKKERKAKREAELLIKKKAKKEAGQIALKKLKSARKAIIDFKETKSAELSFFENSDEAFDIQNEVIKLVKEVIYFTNKKIAKR